MKKPAYKSGISLVSALVILVATLAISLLVANMLPAPSNPNSRASKVSLPAGIRRVVCPGLPGVANAWVQGTSPAGPAEITDYSGKAIPAGTAQTISASGLKLQVKPVARGKRLPPWDRLAAAGLRARMDSLRTSVLPPLIAPISSPPALPLVIPLLCIW